ncbi:ribonuclease H-like domain-containing protein [Spirochaeta cellobiosiphila]|uniref:ribonuclease H-like domain-containing protein n=1 Tax=Spirochaeta cellobiosiphila TaxID=504483 RepID=UPI00040CA992|nr:ribonuclease H-like domain-containing protein [Spirochaeta cellobiosiphila]
MARSSLSSRLGALRQAQELTKKTTVKSKEQEVSIKGLDGFHQVAPHLWLREENLPLPQPYWSKDPYLYNGQRQAEDFLFYDTETTGLSGGAGTVPFLVGIGFIKGDAFQFKQYFLSDYPGEGDLLALIKKDLDPTKLHVSYNGKTYDSHLIRTRFLMNRMNWMIPPQLDLLTISRRLWKNCIGSCKLSNIEEVILGIKRQTQDVPGALVPQMYFDFLKSRDAKDLQGVFYHNQEDIYSLVKLLFYIEKIFAHPFEYSLVDRFRLGLCLQEINRPEGPILIEQSASLPHYHSMRYMGNLYKKRGDWDKALSLWRELASIKPYFAYTELAKYYEHKQKDPIKALDYLNLIPLNVLREGQRNELEKRLKRLKQKI